MPTAFEVLAEPVRRSILDLLLNEPRSVNEIAEGMGISQPSTSKHLKAMREAGLVTARKDGQRRWYELAHAPLLELDRWLEPYRDLWADHLDELERLLDRTALDERDDHP